ncbi:MAG TPA: M4 family metallopeptidase [Candidatus Hydrogenedentes bacterium]|nr:M4 family metallopeptidase [Candidatus Hydrogenedentota bacterium]
MSFFNTRIILSILLALQCSAIAQTMKNPKAETRNAAVEALVNSMRGSGAPDGVRVFKGSDNYVRSIGAPPASYFPVTPGKGAPPANKAQAFLKENQSVFMDDSAAVDFRPTKTKTRTSRSYVRLQQDYSGIPVFGAEATIQLDAANEVVFAFSDIKRDTGDLDNGQVSLSPALSASAAESISIEHIQQPPISQAALRLSGKGIMESGTDGWIDPALHLEAAPATLMIFAPEVVGTGGPTRLVWQTVVSAMDSPAVSEFVLVDAHSGEIAFHYPLVHTALNRQIYDANNTSDDPGTLLRSEGGGAVGSPADVDYAYDYFGDTYDFYNVEHGRDSLNNAGMTLSGTVRYCDPSDTCPYENAFWSDSAQRMYFGQDYASADDVVGHELTHGVTSYESNLIYFNQSGAINESFSDMWGEWIDQTNGAGTDTSGVKWLMGEDLPIGAIRDMSNPPAYGDPDKMSSSYYSANIGDVGGVHYNSGIGNKLCYLLTDGGTFNGYTVSALGISATADLMYECAANLLTSASDYLDLYTLLQQAADNLGYSQADKNNLVNACLAVELGTEPAKMAVGPYAGTWGFPMYTLYHDSRTQSIYLASDLGRSGNITALSLYVTTVPGQTLNYWTIRMKTTSLSAYSTASMDATGWTTCYQANVTISSTGQATFTFSTPFLYDGASNLMIDFSHNNTGYTTQGVCLAFVPGGNRTIIAASDSANGDPLTWSGTTSPTKYLSTAVPCIALTFSAPSATVTNVTSTHANGTFTTGEVIDIDVSFSTTVDVTGSPSLELETGSTNRMATYLSGSGTSTLRFRYSVSAGDTSSDLDYTNGGALQFNGGTIKDTATKTSATLTLPAPGAAGSLGANKAIVIDTGAPAVTVNQASGQADPATAEPVNFRILFSEAINPSTFTSSDVSITGTAGGTPSVALTSSDNIDWNAAVSGFTSGGTVIASLSAGVCADVAGNTNAASTSSDNTVSLQLPSTVDAHSSPQTDFVLGNWYATEEEKVSVLKFKVTDRGGDSLPTLIDRIIINVSGTAGHASQDIAWAELRDASSQITTAASITDAQIVFGSAPNSDSVAQLTAVSENTAVEYTVNIYLNTTLLGEHDQTYVFDIAEPDIGADGGSSSPMAADSGAITPVTGTIFIMALGISITPDYWNIGSGPLSNVVESGAFTVQNLGNVAEDISIKGDNGANGWTLQNTVGTNAFKVEADSGDDGSYEIALSTSEQVMAANLAVSGSSTFGLRYNAPSGDTCGGGIAQDFSITLKASRHTP